ncbi:MAG: NADH-quinone oxidoreductase subunit A [Chloroflexi bacterium]|nr:NADH-quinone oxidoreductase subunit A [Chloroflexota bacterium]
MADWAAAVLAGVVGLLAIGLLFLVSAVLAPRRPSAEKGIPYESGIRPAPYTWSQLHVRYYLFAILFLVFDVEAVFLFPWVLVFAKSGAIVFYEMLVFIVVLLFGVVYAWRKGVLQWR